MKKTAKIRINITFEQEGGQKVTHESLLDLPANEINNLDTCENHLLQVNYTAMREALAKQFSEASKKK